MNEVDFLLQNKFSSLPLESQQEIKRIGPHKPTDFNYQQIESKGRKRNFQQVRRKRINL